MVVFTGLYIFHQDGYIDAPDLEAGRRIERYELLPGTIQLDVESRAIYGRGASIDDMSLYFGETGRLFFFGAADAGKQREKEQEADCLFHGS